MAQTQSSNNNAVVSIINIIVTAGVGVGAWFGSPAMLGWLRTNVPAIRQLTLSPLVLQIIITAAIALIGLLIISLIMSIVVPGDKRGSSEAEIAKQQAKMMADKRAKQGRSGTRKRRKR